MLRGRRRAACPWYPLGTIRRLTRRRAGLVIPAGRLFVPRVGIAPTYQQRSAGTRHPDDPITHCPLACPHREGIIVSRRGASIVPARLLPGCGRWKLFAPYCAAINVRLDDQPGAGKDRASGFEPVPRSWSTSGYRAGQWPVGLCNSLRVHCLRQSVTLAVGPLGGPLVQDRQLISVSCPPCHTMARRISVASHSGGAGPCLYPDGRVVRQWHGAGPTVQSCWLVRA